MNYVTVTDFYTGGTYDSAFQQAFNASRTVRVPAGAYTVANPMVLTSGAALIGDSAADTTITSNNATQAVIRIAANTDYFEIRDLTITHQGSPQSGGDGVQQEGGSSCDHGLMINLFERYNYVGLSLGQTARSVIQNVVSEFNTSDGFLMTGVGTNPLQWQYEGCSAGRNGGNGFHWVTTGSNAGGTSTSTLSNCTTFANSGGGVIASGTSENPLQSIRVMGGFFGSDGGNGIDLNSYGGGHYLAPIYIEDSGQCGIYLTGNNHETHIGAGVVTGNRLDGLLTAATITNVVGGIWQANGLSGQAGRQNGIYIAGGEATITGTRCRDNGAGAQVYGVVANANTLIVGCNLRGNLGAGVTGAPAPESTGNQT